MSDLEVAVATILEDCLAVSKDEVVSVVCDPRTRSIADAITALARSRDAEAVALEMLERASHGSEPPASVAAAMLASDVCIAPTTKSLSHTDARHTATQKGVRIATMPGVTKDMLVRTMSADYAEIRRLSRRVAEILSGANRVRVESPEGTDVTFELDGRSGIPDAGDLRREGAFGNLPAGEGFIAPVEGKTAGRVVFDGSMAPLGLLSEPLIAEVSGGRAEFSGPAADALVAVLTPHGPDAFAIAELGIGTNPAATLTGNVLEDEKILGTIHVAFGDNHSIGGTTRVASHLDGIVLHPTVTVDDSVLLDAGRLMV